MNDIKRDAALLIVFRPPNPKKPLTHQQEQIARLLRKGRLIKQIAADMGYEDDSTVEYHIRQAAAALAFPDTEDLSARDVLLAWAFWAYREDAA